MTPRFAFFHREGALLKGMLWVISAFFLALMVWTWIAAVHANPVLLDLETGKPVRERPPL